MTKVQIIKRLQDTRKFLGYLAEERHGLSPAERKSCGERHRDLTEIIDAIVANDLEDDEWSPKLL